MPLYGLPPTRAADPYERYGIPPLGFRNYWYPAIRSRDIRRGPQRIRLLGEAIAVYRDRDRVFAVRDRCAHHGARLSRGRCEFPGSGTISCPYHGWTYDGRTGACVAQLMQGPDAVLGPDMRIKAYPVEEHGGVVWVFVGDQAPVAIAEDIPGYLLDRDGWFTLTAVADYRCNWRALVDNWNQDWHANYVHRYSPEMIFQPAPLGRDAIVAELPDGKGIGYRDCGGVERADFPGLGPWPPNEWYRVLKPMGLGTAWFDPGIPGAEHDGSTFLKQMRLPAQILVGRAKRNYWLCQTLAPIDENNTRLFNINIFKRTGAFREALARLHYFAWRSWAHDRIFSNQDKRILDDWEIGLEHLAKTDRDVVRWRKFAGRHAREAAPSETPGSRAEPAVPRAERHRAEG